MTQLGTPSELLINPTDVYSYGRQWDISTSSHERIVNFVPTYTEAYHKSEGEVMSTRPRYLCDGSWVYIIRQLLGYRYLRLINLKNRNSRGVFMQDILIRAGS